MILDTVIYADPPSDFLYFLLILLSLSLPKKQITSKKLSLILAKQETNKTHTNNKQTKTPQKKTKTTNKTTNTDGKLEKIAKTEGEDVYMYVYIYTHSLEVCLLITLNS